MDKYGELIEHMREPTSEECRAIQKNIDKISIKTDVNFGGNDIENICFKLACYYMAITELFDRTLTDKRSKYDKTEAFICNGTDRSLSNQHAAYRFKYITKFAENDLKIPHQIFIKNFRNQIKINNLSAQGWIDQYNFLCENGEMDFIKGVFIDVNSKIKTRFSDL